MPVVVALLDTVGVDGLDSDNVALLDRTGVELGTGIMRMPVVVALLDTVGVDEARIVIMLRCWRLLEWC